MCSGSNNCSGVDKQEYKTENSTELTSILEQDYRETNTQNVPTSQDNLKLQQIMEEFDEPNTEENYVMPLPIKWSDEEINLPLSRTQAKNDLLKL